MLVTVEERRHPNSFFGVSADLFDFGDCGDGSDGAAPLLGSVMTSSSFVTLDWGLP